jgi:hypothetical protein
MAIAWGLVCNTGSVNVDVYCFCEFDGDLYVGVNDGDDGVAKLYKLNAAKDGFDIVASTGEAVSNSLNSLEVFNGQLFATTAAGNWYVLNATKDALTLIDSSAANCALYSDGTNLYGISQALNNLYVLNAAEDGVDFLLATYSDSANYNLILFENELYCTDHAKGRLLKYSGGVWVLVADMYSTYFLEPYPLEHNGRLYVNGLGLLRLNTTKDGWEYLCDSPSQTKIISYKGNIFLYGYDGALWRLNSTEDGWDVVTAAYANAALLDSYIFEDIFYAGGSATAAIAPELLELTGMISVDSINQAYSASYNIVKNPSGSLKINQIIQLSPVPVLDGVTYTFPATYRIYDIDGSEFGVAGLTAYFIASDLNIYSVTVISGYTNILVTVVISELAPFGSGILVLENSNGYSDTIPVTIEDTKTIKYDWDLGDSYSSDKDVITHKYLRAGTKVVVLEVHPPGVTTVVVETTIVVLDSSNLQLVEFCLRFAVEDSQGIEWSECSGEDWILPSDVLPIIDDNDVPRMLVEDENDGFVWEDATFDRVINQKPAFVDKYVEDIFTDTFIKWTLSASGTNEYYLERLSTGDPGYLQPKEIYFDSILVDEGVLGSLDVEEWGYGDNDTLGFETIYVRLAGGIDPNAQELGYVLAKFWTEIQTEIWYGEDTSDSSAEEAKQEIVEQHFYTRPFEPANKGNENYDSNGYRIGQIFSLDMYKDGTLVRPFSQVSEIPLSGDIVFSGIKLQGRRFQPVFKTTMSEFLVVGRNLTKIIKPMAGSLIEQTTDRTKAEAALVLPSFFIGRDLLYPLKNRVTGNVVSGNVVVIDGPDGNYGSGFTIPVAGLNLGNQAITGTYTFMVWTATADDIGNIAALPALTQFSDAYNGWILKYVVGTNCPANIIIPAGSVSTIRIYASDISQFFTLYYNSMLYDDEPKSYEPSL